MDWQGSFLLLVFAEQKIVILDKYFKAIPPNNNFSNIFKMYVWWVGPVFYKSCLPWIAGPITRDLRTEHG